MPAHDLRPFLALDWTPIVVAIITLVGVLVSLGVQLFMWRNSRPPSGGHLGKTVEHGAQTSQANNVYLRMLLEERGIPLPEDEA